MKPTNTARLENSDPIGMLAVAAAVGTDAMIHAQERAGGIEVASQDPREWIAVPAQVAHSASMSLDYEGSLAASEIGWSVGHYSLTAWRISLAAYEDLGWQFHPDDVRGFMAYYWHHRRAMDLAHAASDWARANDMHYAGDPGWDVPGNREEHRRRHQLWKSIERWAEDYYMDGDALFMRARLPEGWKIVDDGHHYGYWTHIADDEGFERASIFYKAASYDRNAHMGLTAIPETQAMKAAWDKIAYEDEKDVPYDEKQWTSSVDTLPSRDVVEDRRVVYRMTRPTGEDRGRLFREVEIDRHGEIVRDEEVRPIFVWFHNGEQRCDGYELEREADLVKVRHRQRGGWYTGWIRADRVTVR